MVHLTDMPIAVLQIILENCIADRGIDEAIRTLPRVNRMFQDVFWTLCRKATISIKDEDDADEVYEVLRHATHLDFLQVVGDSWCTPFPQCVKHLVLRGEFDDVDTYDLPVGLQCFDVDGETAVELSELPSSLRSLKMISFADGGEDDDAERVFDVSEISEATAASLEVLVACVLDASFEGVHDMPRLKGLYLYLAEGSSDVDFSKFPELEVVCLDPDDCFQTPLPSTVRVVMTGVSGMSDATAEVVFRNRPPVREMVFTRLWDEVLASRASWKFDVWRTLEVATIFLHVERLQDDIVPIRSDGPPLELHVVFSDDHVPDEKAPEILEQLTFFAMRHVKKVTVYLARDPQEGSTDGNFESEDDAISTIRKYIQCSDVTVHPMRSVSDTRMFEMVWNRSCPASVDPAHWKITSFDKYIESGHM